MPSYLQLGAELVWREQVVPPVMTEVLLDPLRARYGLGPESIGAPGDNNHLYGRHRSRDWCLGSKWCTNRFYGTVDPRDEAGSGSWYRGFDVGITGAELHAATARLLELAWSGRCPGLAEVFGTVDGVNVVGYYQGIFSTSDDSHLYHLHGGVWTQYANDPTTMRMIYAAVTGTDLAKGDDDMFHGQIPAGGDAVTIVPTPWDASQISFGADHGKALLRVARHVVNEGWVDIQHVLVDSEDGARVDLARLASVDRTSVQRIPIDDADMMTTPVGYMAWWG